MKNRKTGLARRQLFLEGLERRELLAGNVLVEVTGGLLKVTGDAAANQITIYQQTNGRFDIAGLDGEEFTGPTTNILARNITVSLGAGDDSVVIAAQPIEGSEEVLPASVLGTTKVDGGDGSDMVTVAVIGRQVNTFVLPSLALTVDGGIAAPATELQNDGVLITNTSAGILTVKTGVGDDLIDLSNVLALTLNVEAGPDNTTATDADIVSATNVTAFDGKFKLGVNNSANFLNVDTGLFGTLAATGGNGVDTVTLGGVTAGVSLSLATHGGADIVTLEDLQSGLTQADYQEMVNLVLGAFGINVSTLPLNLSALISVLPNFPGTMTISTGDGADFVVATNLYSTFALYIYLDGGDDSLVADNVESDFFAWFFGGADTDGRLLTNVDALSELELQFETVLTPSPST